MKRTYSILLGIAVVALILRLFLLSYVHNPGLHDQNHYYNLGKQLFTGSGFSIDYVWQFNRVPKNIVHPIDHWMPLPGIAVMLGMYIGGENIHAAIIPFLIAGCLIPFIVYLFARQYDLDTTSAFIAASLAAVLPDIVWNSLRTDTTILNMVLVPSSLLLLTYSLKHKSRIAWLFCGFLGGLAYLNRNDSIIILPTIWVVLIAYNLFARKTVSHRYLIGAAILIPIFFLLTVLPWLIRNQRELGMLGTAETGRMFFMVDQRDHYAYDTEISLETMLEQRTVPELIGKRLFELAAAFKQLIISLDIMLPILIPLGLLYLLWKRDTMCLLYIAPAIIWLFGILLIYPILIPFKSQSGSFEKAYLSIVPMLIPLGVLALKHASSNKHWQVAIAVVAVFLMTANSYDLVRQETSLADDYYANIMRLIDEIKTLSDVNGDNEIRFMTQDPYVMSYFGYKSVMTPLTTREKTIELAKRFGLDYLIMPAARPALDSLYMQNETDPHFVFTTEVVLSTGRTFELYAIHTDDLNE